MKASEFRKFYLSFVKLYGAIYSDDAYVIMKKFYPDLTKKDMNADLKERKNKFTRIYQVIPTTDRRYVICDELFDDDDIYEMFSEHMDKPFYICDDLERYWAYGQGDFEKSKDYDKLRRYIRKRFKGNDRDLLTDRLMDGILYIIHNSEVRKMFDDTARLMESYGILKDETEVQGFFDLFIELEGNSRLRQNRGHTPNELRSMRKADINNVTMELGENMTRMFLSGEMDVYEYLDHVKKMELPAKMKEELIRQLEEIIRKKDPVFKA